MSTTRTAPHRLRAMGCFGVSVGGRRQTRPMLTDTDKAILAFERHWWKYAGAKEQAVREKFEMSATRYYQVLDRLLDEPAAEAHDPMLVGRLRRLREARRRVRGA